MKIINISLCVFDSNFHCVRYLDCVSLPCGIALNACSFRRPCEVCRRRVAQQLRDPFLRCTGARLRRSAPGRSGKGIARRQPVGAYWGCEKRERPVSSLTVIMFISGCAVGRLFGRPRTQSAHVARRPWIFYSYCIRSAGGRVRRIGCAESRAVGTGP